MRLNPTYQNHMKDWVKGSVIMYGVLVGVYLLSLIVAIFIPAISGGTFDGLEFVSYIFVMVAGITSFKPNLKLALANGISRKTEFTASMLSAATISVIFLAANSLIGLLFGTITTYQSDFQTMYTSSDFPNNGVYGLMAAIYNVFSLFGSYTFGYFVGGLYYRMSKPLKIVVSVGVPVMAFIGFPIIGVISYKNELIAGIITYVIKTVGTIIANPYLTTLWDLILAIAFLVFSFLLIRRAPLKEQG